jgi:serine/threonine protein kinase
MDSTPQNPFELTLQSSEAAKAVSRPATVLLRPGEIVAGRYRVLAIIGTGGMGTVYRVEQLFLKKEFALKTLHSTNTTDLKVRRFQKEAQLASRLDHENLVRALDFGLIDNSQPFLIMDLVEGLTLAKYLESNGRMPVDLALQTFIPICFAMAHAHNEGVIHRDIKPGNIVLTRSRPDSPAIIPKIVDFGIAKVMEGEEQTLTETGQVFGTPLYMSPEQTVGSHVDLRSDIYSLGCVFFEALTGVPPFKGETLIQTILQHRNKISDSLKKAALGLEFPEGLEQIVAKMLAKDPEARYQDCLTIAQDLSWLSQGKTENIYARVAPNKVLEVLDEPKKYFSTSMLVTALITAALVSACFVSIWFILNPPGKSDSPSSTHVLKYDAEGLIMTEVFDHKDDMYLYAVTQNYSSLDSLNLHDKHITDYGMRCFRVLHHIKNLDLSGCEHVTNKGIEYLTRLPLERLNLTGTDTDSACLTSLIQIPTLVTLSLMRTDFDDAGCRNFRLLPKLKFLHLGESRVTAKGVNEIVNPQLIELNLDSCSIRGALHHLTEMNLLSLSLSRCEISNSDCDVLQHLPKVQTLILDRNPINDDGLLKLAALPNLKHLCVRLTNVTAQGKTKFARLKPNCSLETEDINKHL